MGKKAKEHRKKVAKRNESIKLQQKRIKQAQQDFLMEMIEKEKLAGKFDNNPQMPIPGGYKGPAIDLGQGPQI